MKLKNRIFYADKTMTILVLVLSFVSSIMVYSTWSITTVVFGGSSALGIFGKQIMFIVLSIILYFIVTHIPYKRFKIFAPMLWLITVGLLIVVFFFPAINESRSWIPVPGVGFNFQPSELAKIVLIFMVAAYYDRLITKKVPMDYSNWFFKPLVIISIPIVLIVAQPDPGTALIIVMFLGIMLFATGYKLRYLLKGLTKLLIPLSLVLGLVFTLNVIYDGAVTESIKSSQARMISRFDYKDPCDDFNASGFQICNSLIAINSGGLTGKGLGNSTQKYLYLPESHTDAIFAVTAEEHGFVSTTLLLLIYTVLIYKILYYAKKTSSVFASLTCIGIAFMFLAHIFVNVAGILNMIPFTGVPLHFYSYGGTFSLLCFGSLGVVQSIAIEVNREEVLNNYEI